MLKDTDIFFVPLTVKRILEKHKVSADVEMIYEKYFLSNSVNMNWIIKHVNETLKGKYFHFWGHIDDAIEDILIKNGVISTTDKIIPNEEIAQLFSHFEIYNHNYEELEKYLDKHFPSRSKELQAIWQHFLALTWN